MRAWTRMRPAQNRSGAARSVGMQPSRLFDESHCTVCAQLEGIQEAKGQGRLDSHAAGDSYASRVSSVLVLLLGFKLRSQH